MTVKYIKNLKPYESTLTTWNRGKFGKYKILKKINKKAFKDSVVKNHKVD